MNVGMVKCLRTSLAVIAAASFAACGGGGRVAFDLIELFPKAKERRPSNDSQAVVDATIKGDKRKAILFKEEGRVKYEFEVPESAAFEVGVGMLEEAWSIPGDGVVIYIYVTPLGADGQPTYDQEKKLVTRELLSLAVNPHGTPADQVWHDLMLDLSEFAGKRVELVLVSRASPPSTARKSDASGDQLVWGNPRITVQ
jgi:hypothetical protein